MLFKLLKLEFRSTIQTMAAAWGGFLGISLLLMVLSSTSIYDNMMFFGVLSILVYGILFGTMVVATIGIIIMRFYKGMCGDEGYLIHTLPVKEWQVIVAKALTALVLLIISCIEAYASICIISYSSFASFWLDFSAFFRELFHSSAYLTLAIGGLIVLLTAGLKTIYSVYASLSIGQLFNRHRIAIAVVTYILIDIIISIILWSIFMIFDNQLLAIISFSDTSTALHIGKSLIILFLGEFIQVAIFHIITERIMTKKLNLL